MSFNLASYWESVKYLDFYVRIKTLEVTTNCFNKNPSN